jgi:hypothetical protein
MADAGKHLKETGLAASLRNDAPANARALPGSGDGPRGTAGASPDICDRTMAVAQVADGDRFFSPVASPLWADRARGGARLPSTRRATFKAAVPTSGTGAATHQAVGVRIMDKAAYIGLARALRHLELPPRDDQFAALLAQLDAIELRPRAARGGAEPAHPAASGRLRSPRRGPRMCCRRSFVRNLTRRAARRRSSPVRVVSRAGRA